MIDNFKTILRILQRNLFVEKIKDADFSSVVERQVTDLNEFRARNKRYEELAKIAVELLIEEHVIEQLDGDIRARAEKALILRKESIANHYPEYFPLKTAATRMANLKHAGDVH